MVATRFTIAISAEFFTAYAKLPKTVQNTVLPIVSKFREDPTQPELNYEKLNALDPKLIALNIDENYRCIVMYCDTVFVLLWVAPRAEANAWAENRKCIIDVHTGGLQILMVQEARGSAKQQSDTNLLCPWAEYQDERFAQLGVPAQYREALRKIEPSELEQYANCFSKLTWECLHLLLEGTSWEKVEEILNEAQTKEAVDTEDFKAALKNPTSRSSFMVDPEHHELEVALEKPLEQWRIFLHPTQYALVERDWNGPVRVLGGAGTGKTVVAMHRARWLASKCPKGEKILFTTFSTTLADDLRQNMASLCSPEEMSHIEIINLDKWVYAYLKRENFHYKFCTEKDVAEIWKQVVPLDSPFDRAFCQDEWKNVIQQQEITKFEEYIRAPRTGRGKGITRAERKLLWPIFEDFRILMRDRQFLEQEDAMRMARERVLANKKAIYWSVIVDEAQDLSVHALKLLRVLVKETKNDMFIVGDGHQRIYRNPVSLKSCGIAITGRAKKLRINYRTTEEIRKQAQNYLEGVMVDDLDGGSDSKGEYISLIHGPAPIKKTCENFEERMRFVAAIVSELEANGVDKKDICFTLPSLKEIERCKTALEEIGVPTYCLTNKDTDVADNRTKQGIRLATRHRVKGLEFTAVILAEWQAQDDSLEDKKTRFLSYVAATRAKQYLYIVA
ncbi:MAG: AAA family ATPase [Desulfovibrionaceae bacterium]|nr:AAA family ATPase [Desulfovibrionaceae bacterium]